MKLLLLVSITTFVEITDGTVTCEKIGPCACELSNGKGKVDLSPLMKLGKAPLYTGIVGEGLDSKFSFDPCRDFPCADKGQTRVCSTSSTSEPAGIGKDITYHYDETKSIVSFIYSQISSQISTVHFKTTIEMHCESKKDGIGTLNIFKNNPTMLFNFYTSLDSKYACLVKSNGKKLSTGTILCILLLVFVFLYVVAGILINKYVRKLETDLFPNKTFWKDFPSLVKTGFAFTIEKLPIGKKSEYEQI